MKLSNDLKNSINSKLIEIFSLQKVHDHFFSLNKFLCLIKHKNFGGFFSGQFSLKCS